MWKEQNSMDSSPVNRDNLLQNMINFNAID